MNPNAPLDPDELLWRHVDGSLSEADEAALRQLLEEHPEYGKRLFELAEERLALQEALAAPASASRASQRSVSSKRLQTLGSKRGMSVRRKKRSGSRSSWGWMLAGTLAACVALMAGFTLLQKPTDAHESLATLHDSKGEWKIERSGETLPAHDNLALLAGDVLNVTTGAGAVVYADGTRIDVSVSTRVSLSANDGAKLVDLQSGTLDASVAKQPIGKPMLFSTQNAKATVLGTSLKLSSAATGTRLDVAHGKVRLALKGNSEGLDVTDGRSAEVTATGQLAFVTLETPPVAEKKPEPFGPKSGRPFSDSSLWNTPIPENPVLDPQSAAIVSNIGRSASVSMFKYAVQIYNADATTPIRKVTTTRPKQPSPFVGFDVRIPEGAKPNSGANASFIVLDWSARRTWEFYKFKWVGSDVQTYGGGSIPFDENGVDMVGSGTAGASQLAGLIRLHEIENGHIDHAVSVASKFATKETRYPAHGNDGDFAGPGGLPVGAHIQLDPTIDVAAIPGISRGELAIARALQKYGGYCCGRTTQPMLFNFELAADATAQNSPGAIYSANGFPNGEEMTHIPWNRLRVLKIWNGKERE